MKIPMLLQHIGAGSLILLIAALLRGHDVLTGLFLVSLFLGTILAFWISLRSRQGDSRSDAGGGNGGGPSLIPVLRPPGGRPPVPVGALDE